MKFLSVFAVSLVLCFLFQFFFGHTLSESFWLPVLVYAFVIAAVIWAYLQQEEKLEDLERHLRELEKEKESGL